MEPKTISTETIYKGKVFDIRVDEVREGDVEYKRDVVRVYVARGLRSVAATPVS